jgi:LCP family protein required for cell wall assembly
VNAAWSKSPEVGGTLSNLVRGSEEELAQTTPSQPAPSLEEYQRIHVGERKPLPDIRRGEHRRLHWKRWAVLGAIILYFLAPLRTNILMLGTDDSAARGALGRTDTIILSTITPYYTGLLGIPRDLWVNVAGVGPQRINTAYFFAEAASQGSGPEAAMGTVRQNFGVTVNNYLLIHMAGLADVIDSLGGIDLTIDKPMAGYAPGTYHMDGKQALAFVRERYSSDDFSRMRQGQLLVMAAFRRALSPSAWPHVPSAAIAAAQSINTDLPAWLYPRLGLALLRTAIFGFDGRTINRDMVAPFQTDQGAQVLAPNWDAINPVLRDMFGQ